MNTNKLLLLFLFAFIECNSPKKIENLHSTSFPNYYKLTFNKKIKSISSIDVDSFKYVNTKIYKLDTLFKIESHRILKSDTQLLEIMKSESKIYFYTIYFRNKKSDYYDGMYWENDSIKWRTRGPARCRGYILDGGKSEKKLNEEMEKFVDTINK